MAAINAPPFTEESAARKVKGAQDLWNTRNPDKVALAYTEQSIWRNRDVFIQGHDEIIEFLTAKWQRETEYKLKKVLFAHTADRIAVQFYYEYYSLEEQSWKRAYGLEHWSEYDSAGRMGRRWTSINEIAIEEGDRWFKEGVDVDAFEVPSRGL